MGVEVFQCNFGNSLKSFLSAKNQEKLFIQVDDTKPEAGVKITGKGYVCNEEGKNEYISQIDYNVADVREVKKGEFQGIESLIIVTKLKTLYGNKKTQNIFPGVKDIDRAIDIITRIAKENGGLCADTPSAPVATAAPRPVPKAAPAPAKPSPAPAPKPAPAPAPAPAPKAAASEPTTFTADAPAKSSTDNYVPSAAAVAASTAPSTTFTSATTKSTVVKPPVKKSSDVPFEERMKKLEVLHGTGVLSDVEYNDKKIGLICDEKGLGAFYERIQKIFTLRRSGMLNDAEFESNKSQIVDECFDTTVTDLKVFSENMVKLPIIKMSELIDEFDFDSRMNKILSSVEYKAMDSNEVFCLKLQKLPILRDNGMIQAEEYEKDIIELKSILDPHASDSIDALDMKLSRWPAMVKAGTVSDSEYRQKQQIFLEEVMSMPAGDEASLKDKTERIIKMKEKDWLRDMDFHSKKVEILKDVQSVQDYILRTKLYMVARTTGFISQDDYDTKKKELITDIFAPYADMDEFQAKVTKLMNIYESGIISEEDYAKYKDKLLKDL